MDQVAHLIENAGECRRQASQAVDVLAIRVLKATAEGYEREAAAEKREKVPSDGFGNQSESGDMSSAEETTRAIRSQRGHIGIHDQEKLLELAGGACQTAEHGYERTMGEV